MTNDEAIKYLIVPTATSTEPSAEYLKQKEAYDLAIKALNTQESLEKKIEFLMNERPQGECVDINKLRLMTVEECAGHTIDYAMGWKACVEWIKKGGAK